MRKDKPVYANLNDAANNPLVPEHVRNLLRLPDDRGVIEVWFGRLLHAEKFGREQTHTLVGRIAWTDNFAWRDQVFAAMQGESWSPKGEANGLVCFIFGPEEHAHTSMSVGDVIVRRKAGGPDEIWRVAPQGFTAMKVQIDLWKHDRSWRLDPIHNHADDCIMYKGGADGVYIAIHGLRLTAGWFKDGVPHIGEALFTTGYDKTFMTTPEIMQLLIDNGFGHMLGGIRPKKPEQCREWVSAPGVTGHTCLNPMPCSVHTRTPMPENEHKV